MNCLLQTYIVRTLHPAGFSGSAFIVPIPIEAATLEDAARKRFDLLSPNEQSRCRALLVECEADGVPHLFEVETITVPSYEIKAAGA